LARLDAVREDLTNNVNQLQQDLLSARGVAARAESEAMYHKDKCERLEASMDRTRVESLQVDRARSSLSSVHAERTRLEGEKRHIEANVRLIETQLSTARAAEGWLVTIHCALKLPVKGR
jgi:catechol-2,3-dioxygenase